MDKPQTYTMRRSVDAHEWTAMRGLTKASINRAIAGLGLMRAMMTGSKSTLACFHIELGKPHQYSCTLWRREADGSYQLSDGSQSMTERTLEEICGWLGGLARDIAAQWPVRARPSTIGLATDGHWIVFNAAHPSCHGTDWIDQHLSGRSPATIVVRDKELGFLSSLSQMQEMQ